MPNAQRPAGLFLLTLVACLVAGPLAFAQGTDEQTAACSGDAFTLCRGDIPDVAKITACMKVHKAELSSRCRAVFDAGDRKAAPAPKVAEPKEAAKPSKTAAVKKAPLKKAAKASEAKTPQPKAVPPKAHAPRIVAEHPPRPRATQPVATIEPRPRRATIVVVAPRPPAPPEQPSVAPAVPAPERLPGLAAYRASIVSSCEKGQIDPYTCRSTLDALKSIE